MRRSVLVVSIGAAGLVLAAASGAARPAVSLLSGQTRWFLPDSLQTNEQIGCGATGSRIEVKVPAPPAAGVSGSDVAFGSGTAAVTIQRRSNGATEITCGVSDSGFPQLSTVPYVIGQNGLGLLRGPNHLSALERLFGRPGVSGPTGSACRATWQRIGLVATFAGRACTGSSQLVTAAVTGSMWNSLTDVHIGESIAEMRWEDPTAKLVSTKDGQTTWQLASGGASHKAKLLAVTGHARTITSFVAIVS